MEEGQLGSPKGSNRTGNPAIGTLSWQSFQERDPTGYRELVTSVMRDDFTMLFKIANPVHTGIDKYQLKILRPITAGFFDLRMCDKYTKQNLFFRKAYAV